MNHSQPAQEFPATNTRLTKFTVTKLAVTTLSVLLYVAILPGCGGGTATDPSSAAAPSDSDSALDSINESLVYKLPEGNAAKLLEFIEQMSVQQPQGANDDERTKDVGDIFTARAAAAERIINGPEAKSYGKEATRIRLESLRVLANIGLPDADKNVKAYAAELSSNEDKDLARVGRYGVFSISLDELMSNPQSDGQSVIDNINKFVESEPRDQELLFLINEAADTFGMSDRQPQARQLLKLIADTFGESTNEQLAAQGNEAQARLHMMELQDGFVGVMQNVEGADSKLVEGVTEVLDSNPPSASLGVVMDLSQKLENASRKDLASQLYTRLEKTLDAATSADDMTGMIRKGVQRANVRMNLVGKTPDIQGTTTFGKEFDWSRYKGKVVLIDFWATWCGPCIAEIPNLINLHERYSSQGFEIVGINLDDDVAAAVNFLEDRELPWVSVMSPGGGEKNVNAESFGVETIPFILLVGDDGKIIASHLRGEQIGEALGDIFESDDADVVIEMDDEVAEMNDEVAEMNDEVVEATEEEAEEETEAADAAAEPDDQAAIPARRNGEQMLALAPQQVLNGQAPAAPAESSLTKEQNEANPYEPDAELSTKQLYAFILDMQDKTKSIQFRDGFREGICVAADRVLGSDDASARHREVAAEAKLEYLHRDACLGDDVADDLLSKATESLAGESSEKTQRLVRFFEVERKVINAADTPPDDGWHTETWKQSLEYLESEKESLSSQHLRMASSLVEILNDNPDVAERESDFDTLSKLLVASKDPVLRRYGKRIGPKNNGESTEWIGKPLELAGTTVDGIEFSAKEFLGKIVVVDFWATWCGPCRAALPELQELYKKHKDSGLEIVGVSIDHDEDALAGYLDDNDLPWTHLSGESATELAKKYGVGGIPAMLLVDQRGKIVSRGRTANDFKDLITKLIADGKDGE